MRELTTAHVQAASSREGIQQLLAHLGYDTSEPVEQTPAALGVAERGQHAVLQVWRLAAQRVAPGTPPALEVYWFELKALTADLRKALAAAFRNKPGNALLLLTTRDFDPLDFVLVEKVAAAAAPTGKVAVSVRFFSVARRHPSGVHLRVLGRMDNIAPDPYAQYDRLRDAFSLAEWSEDEFNNRNLFSDYFLKHRLPDRQLFPVWETTDVRPAHRDLSRLLDAAGDVRGLSAADLRARFIAPALEALGFRLDAPGRDDPQVDALLRPRGAAEDAPASAALLAYPWDRPLDRK